jgi:hypothetical protein
LTHDTVGPIVAFGILGLLLLWFGVIWTLQGLNVWHGTVMSGSARWLTIGVVLDVVAILLLVRAGLLLQRRPVKR